MSKTTRTLLLALSTMVLGGLMWIRCPSRHTRRHQHASDIIPDNAAVQCAGWPEHVPGTAEALAPFLSPGFRELLEHDPLRAWDAFSRASAGPATRAGLVRARLETGLVLRAARDLAFTSLRLFLDRRIAEHLTIGPGEELVPLLRAALALQSGETRDIQHWTARVPPDSPLFQAARWLDTVSRRAPAGRGPEHAARWWRSQLDGWRHAIDVDGCAVDTRTAVLRLGVLSRWTAQGRIPPPREWPDRLRLHAADFRAGGCHEGIADRLELFDPSIYTVLAASVLEQVAAAPVENEPERYFRLQAATTLGLNTTTLCAGRRSTARDAPEHAREETSWATALPYLIYGDVLSPRELEDWVERTCRGDPASLPPCAADSDAVRSALERAVRWDRGCASWLAGVDPTRGKMAETYHFYGGAARARFFREVEQARCDPGVRLQAYQFWKGKLEAPNPWWCLECRIRWLELDTGTRAFRDGAAEVFLMAERDAVFFPLSEMVRAAQLTTSAAGSISETMR